MSEIAMITAARLRASFDRPYLATALYALHFVPKPGLGTVGVDARWRCYYDEEWCSKLPVEQLAAVLIHEVGHLLRDHAGRKGVDQNHIQWNIAGDLEINDDLLEEGLPLPEDGSWPSKFKLPDGKLAEEYYDLLEDKIIKIKVHQITGGKCGSCAHGQQEEHEDPAPQQGREGNQEGTTPAVSAGQAELIRREVARDIAGQPPGRVPGGWKRWADEKLRSKVDWRAQLRSAIRNTVAVSMGADDYSWSRPSRRQGGTNVILPALRGRKPKAGLIIDTSGSMSEKMLGQALVEVQGVIQALGSEVYVAAADTQLHNVKRVWKASDVELLGGGGTDMSQAIVDFLDKPEGKKVNSLIVITDCETGWPAQKPALPCTIVNVGGGAPPPWPCSLVKVELDG